VGQRGPVPKRSDRRVRRNKDGGEVERIAVDAGFVAPPPLEFETHPLAKGLYEDLGRSAQARYFEPSDWRAAQVVVHELGRMLNAGKPSGQLLSAVWSALSDLLVTEGQRRRMRLEIERMQDGTSSGEDADVIELYKGLGL